MEGVLSKRKRESEDPQVCKRLKDAQGLPQLLEAPAVCSVTPVVFGPTEGCNLLPALQRCFVRCQEAMTSVLAHSLLPPATNLQQALAECDPTPFQALFPSGFTEVYARERARYQSLRLQAEALETQIRSLEATSEAQRVQAKARLSDLERSSELRLSEHSLALDTVNHNITKFLSIHELYHRLSGLEILQSGTGQFRCKIRVQQNELIFKVSEESDQLLGMTLVSYTVPGERIPQHLKEGLEMEQRQEPVLLWQLFACLL